MPSVLYYLRWEATLLLESIRSLRKVIGTRKKHSRANHSADWAGGEIN